MLASLDLADWEVAVSPNIAMELAEPDGRPTALPVVRRFSLTYSLPSMANLYYNERLIIAFASFNQSDKQWSAGAEITWKADGRRQSHSLGGFADRFKSSDDAEKFIVNLAKAWINANP